MIEGMKEAVVKIFVKDGCPQCPLAKELGEKLARLGKHIEVHNIAEVKGLSEAVVHEIFCAPSVVIAGPDNKEIAAWRCKTPAFEEIKDFL